MFLLLEAKLPTTLPGIAVWYLSRSDCLTKRIAQNPNIEIKVDSSNCQLQIWTNVFDTKMRLVFFRRTDMEAYRRSVIETLLLHSVVTRQDVRGHLTSFTTKQNGT